MCSSDLLPAEWPDLAPEQNNNRHNGSKLDNNLTNQNAIRAAARIDFLRPEDGTSPYQLQPFVKRENKEMSR